MSNALDDAVSRELEWPEDAKRREALVKRIVENVAQTQRAAHAEQTETDLSVSSRGGRPQLASGTTAAEKHVRHAAQPGGIDGRRAGSDAAAGGVAVPLLQCEPHMVTPRVPRNAPCAQLGQ